MQAAVHQTVTEARRDVIYDVVLTHATHNRPATVGNVLRELLQNRISDWPQATWLHANNTPYSVGVNQHLKAMVRRGELTEVPGGYGMATVYHAVVPRPQRPEPRAPKAPRTRRPHGRARAAEALALKKDGLNGPQIADRMGLSRSYTYLLLNDPTGDKERARKARYCKVCGGKKTDDRCELCHEKKVWALLPPLHFERFVHMAANMGLEIVFGVTHDYRRVIRQGTGRGFAEYVLEHDERWEEAVYHLGFVPR